MKDGMNEIVINEQKYKTIEERLKAFSGYCYKKKGCEYKLHGCDEARCFAHWLTLEADEKKPENCPFCGRGTMSRHLAGGFCVECDCGYTSPFAETKVNSIAAHNHVARLVRAAKKINN